tara:strand:+ start:522 stop:737 length:216 start_codon:yes stop_codon:yes gene_type:complete
MKQNTRLNNSQEENLRIKLVESNNKLISLNAHISTLERMVKEEQDGKYEAYKRIHALNTEVTELKKLLATD